jgi:hypothetical protein
MIFLAIYSETFSDAEPVKQEVKIDDVFCSVFSRECNDSGCLG